MSIIIFPNTPATDEPLPFLKGEFRHECLNKIKGLEGTVLILDTGEGIPTDSRRVGETVYFSIKIASEEEYPSKIAIARIHTNDEALITTDVCDFFDNEPEQLWEAVAWLVESCFTHGRSG